MKKLIAQKNGDLQFLLKARFSLIIFFSLICSIELIAQSTITSTGNNSTGSGGSSSYTVGQIICETDSSSSGSVITGVQLVFEISVVDAISDSLGIELYYKVYPNPTTHFLILEVNTNPNKLKYQLFDISGKLVLSNSIQSTETKLSTENLINGVYFLKIIKGDKVIKTFKIIKNK